MLKCKIYKVGNFITLPAVLRQKSIGNKEKKSIAAYKEEIIVNLKLNSSRAVYSQRLKNVPFPKEIRVFEPYGNRLLLLLYMKFTIFTSLRLYNFLSLPGICDA